MHAANTGLLSQTDTDPRLRWPGVVSIPDARGVVHVHRSGRDERRELSGIIPPPSLACFAEGDQDIPFPLARIEFRVAHSPSSLWRQQATAACVVPHPPQRVSKPRWGPPGPNPTGAAGLFERVTAALVHYQKENDGFKSVSLLGVAGGGVYRRRSIS
ncbi:hypothetical protein B5X24_HaOG212838 [Helicoverpa armigera]|nr:hypothetical protein B5X24_HaOG212838 [Helicoverpa armigera]